MKQRKTRKLNPIHVRWLVGTAVLGVVVVSLLPVPVTFNIRVSTQVVKFEPSESHRSEWQINRAILRGSSDKARPLFTGVLRVLPGSYVVFTRIGSGPLNISIRASHTGEAVVKILANNSDKWTTLNDKANFTIPLTSLTGTNHTMSVFPLSGTITLGADIPERIIEQPLLLINGSVTMLSHVLVGKEKYEAGRSMLDIGDKLKVKGDNDVYGIIMVGVDPDLSALCRVVTKRLQVYRFGTLGYTLSTSLLSRIQNDPLVQLVWGASLLLVGFLMRWFKQ